MKFRFWHDRCHGASRHEAWQAHFGRSDGHRWGSHWEHWSRHGGGHHGRSRSRMFEQGDLRFVVLKLLAEKPAHGYEIIKSVENLFGGVYAPSPGIVYPTLTMLEEQGFIAIVEEAGSRKLYGLTEAGRAELARCKLDVERVFEQMNAYRKRYGGGPAPEVLRAMDNLQTALRLRLDRGAPDDVGRITSILDGAARAIEELP